ncbi:hypothetical protein M9Y10_030957 [Tritrichomonas musculus]|uniref:Uncharacterized protein n=1 Tax=Tritrichomonas musculus TaxID=1915356 RepID=A0ABR2H3H9_9EUKA
MQDNLYGLTIHLLSFQLNDNLIHNNDKIRVSITTIPEEKKQNFIIDPKDIGDAHKYFTVNISDQTKKILFIFRRKSILQADPIIASTIIRREQFPSMKSSKESKTITLFEKISKKKKENVEDEIDSNLNKSKKSVGQMNVQLELADPFPEQELNTRSAKRKGRNSFKGGYANLNLNDENMDANICHNENE